MAHAQGKAPYCAGAKLLKAAWDILICNHDEDKTYKRFANDSISGTTMEMKKYAQGINQYRWLGREKDWNGFMVPADWEMSS